MKLSFAFHCCVRESLKKRQADDGKLTYSTKHESIFSCIVRYRSNKIIIIIIIIKANGDHIKNTHVSSLHVFVQICWVTRRSGSSALSFAVNESERKEKFYLNSASKRVNHLATSSKQNLHNYCWNIMPITSRTLRQTTVSLTHKVPKLGRKLKQTLEVPILTHEL